MQNKIPRGLWAPLSALSFSISVINEPGIYHFAANVSPTEFCRHRPAAIYFAANDSPQVVFFFFVQYCEQT